MSPSAEKKSATPLLKGKSKWMALEEEVKMEVQGSWVYTREELELVAFLEMAWARLYGGFLPSENITRTASKEIIRTAIEMRLWQEANQGGNTLTP